MSSLSSSTEFNATPPQAKVSLKNHVNLEFFKRCFYIASIDRLIDWLDKFFFSNSSSSEWNLFNGNVDDLWKKIFAKSFAD